MTLTSHLHLGPGGQVGSDGVFHGHTLESLLHSSNGFPASIRLHPPPPPSPPPPPPPVFSCVPAAGKCHLCWDLLPGTWGQPPPPLASWLMLADRRGVQLVLTQLVATLTRLAPATGGVGGGGGGQTCPRCELLLASLFVDQQLLVCSGSPPSQGWRKERDGKVKADGGGRGEIKAAAI